MSSKKEMLLDYLKREALIRKGLVRLSSGDYSDLYVDCRRLLRAPVVKLLGEVLLEEILSRYPDVEAVGGLETGAIPLTTAVLSVASFHGPPLKGFFCRKIRKDHGLKRLVEGPVRAGDKVVVLDDVLTTGASLQHVITCCLSSNLKVIGSLVLVSRNPSTPVPYVFSLQDLL